MGFSYQFKADDGFTHVADSDASLSPEQLQQHVNEVNASLEATRQQTLQQQADNASAGRFGSYLGSGVQGFVQPLASAVRGVGEALDAPALIRGGNSLQARTAATVPVNPQYGAELPAKIAGSVGGLAGAALPFAIPGAGEILGSLSLIPQTYDSGYQQGEAAGLPASDIQSLAAANTAIQTPLMIAGGRIVRGLALPAEAGAEAATAPSALRDLGVGALEAGAIGSGSRLAENALAGPGGYNTDPNRGLTDDVLGSGALMAGSAALLGAPRFALSKIFPPKPPAEPAPPATAEPETDKPLLTQSDIDSFNSLNILPPPATPPAPVNAGATLGDTLGAMRDFAARAKAAGLAAATQPPADAAGATPETGAATPASAAAPEPPASVAPSDTATPETGAKQPEPLRVSDALAANAKVEWQGIRGRLVRGDANQLLLSTPGGDYDLANNAPDGARLDDLGVTPTQPDRLHQAVAERMKALATTDDKGEAEHARYEAEAQAVEPGWYRDATEHPALNEIADLLDLGQSEVPGENVPLADLPEYKQQLASYPEAKLQTAENIVVNTLDRVEQTPHAVWMRNAWAAPLYDLWHGIQTIRQVKAEYGNSERLTSPDATAAPGEPLPPVGGDAPSSGGADPSAGATDPTATTTGAAAADNAGDAATPAAARPVDAAVQRAAEVAAAAEPVSPLLADALRQKAAATLVAHGLPEAASPVSDSTPPPVPPTLTASADSPSAAPPAEASPSPETVALPEPPAELAPALRQATPTPGELRSTPDNATPTATNEQITQPPRPQLPPETRAQATPTATGEAIRPAQPRPDGTSGNSPAQLDQPAADAGGDGAEPAGDVGRRGPAGRLTPPEAPTEKQLASGADVLESSHGEPVVMKSPTPDAPQQLSRQQFRDAFPDGDPDKAFDAAVQSGAVQPVDDQGRPVTVVRPDAAPPEPKPVAAARTLTRKPFAQRLRTSALTDGDLDLSADDSAKLTQEAARRVELAIKQNPTLEPFSIPLQEEIELRARRFIRSTQDAEQPPAAGPVENESPITALRAVNDDGQRFSWDAVTRTAASDIARSPEYRSSARTASLDEPLGEDGTATRADQLTAPEQRDAESLDMDRRASAAIDDYKAALPNDDARAQLETILGKIRNAEPLTDAEIASFKSFQDYAAPRLDPDRSPGAAERPAPAEPDEASGDLAPENEGGAGRGADDGEGVDGPAQSGSEGQPDARGEAARGSETVDPGSPEAASQAQPFDEGDKVIHKGRSGIVEKVNGDRATVRLRPTPQQASEVRDVHLSELRAPEARTFQLPDSPIGAPDVIDHIDVEGGMRSKGAAERIAKGKGLTGGAGADYNDLPNVKGIYQQRLFRGTAEPNQMASLLHSDYDVGDGTTGEMYRAIDAAMKTRDSAKEERERQEAKEKQLQRFTRDSGEPTKRNNQPVYAESLRVGDTVTVSGQKLRVVDVNPDGVELEDHSKYGIQEISEGQVIYAEKLSRARRPKGGAAEDDWGVEPETKPATPESIYDSPKVASDKISSFLTAELRAGRKVGRLADAFERIGKAQNDATIRDDLITLFQRAGVKTPDDLLQHEQWQEYVRSLRPDRIAPDEPSTILPQSTAERAWEELRNQSSGASASFDNPSAELGARLEKMVEAGLLSATDAKGKSSISALAIYRHGRKRSRPQLLQNLQQFNRILMPLNPLRLNSTPYKQRTLDVLFGRRVKT